MSCLSVEKKKTSVLTALLSEKNDGIYINQEEDFRTIKCMQFSTEMSICKNFLYFLALGIPEMFIWTLCCRQIFS